MTDGRQSRRSQPEVQAESAPPVEGSESPKRERRGSSDGHGKKQTPTAATAEATGTAAASARGHPERKRGRKFRPEGVSPRWLANAPTAANFVAPAIQGFFAELQVHPVGGQSEPSKEHLAPYTRYDSPATPANPAAFNIRQIVIKLVEGTSVRLRACRLRQVKVPDAMDACRRLERAGHAMGEVSRELRAFNKTVNSAGALLGRAAPHVSEEDLRQLCQRAESNSGQEMPDLNLFYFVHLPEMDSEAAQQFLYRLRAFRIIEVAYFQPIPFDAADIPPLTTIDVTPSQGYFRKSPTGIDVDFVRHFRSGRGNTIRIADIESGWYWNHEDLPSISFGFGVNWGFADAAAGNHGAAVLGEIAAQENGFGANGIVPNATVGVSSTTNLDPQYGIYFYSVGSALTTAVLRALRPGDIALIEQQFQHWDEGFICDPATDPCGDCSIPPWVAVEEYPQEHAAISVATRSGIVVVEAAGNGRQSVTPASIMDSGAIVVGASDTALRPMCWSNFGPRVNVHGWGMNVGTTGYGETPALRANGPDPSQWYTRSFSGTSSASPIVAGAAAIIQSTRDEVGLPMLDSVAMRSLLATTGTPQAVGSTPNIGPLPDLRAAIATYRPDAARFVSDTGVSSIMAPGATFMYSATFANSGGATWVGQHTMSVAPSSQTGLPIFQAPTFALGSPSAEVFPEDQVTRTFSITAPTQPGTYSLTVVLRNGSGQVLARSTARQIVVAAPGSTFDNALISIIVAPSSLTVGQSAAVTVQAENIGSTTWSPATYILRLQRGLGISLPQQTVPLLGLVSPGAAQTNSFTISCNSSGQGWFSVQMSGPTGTFGQQASRTVICH